MKAISMMRDFGGKINKNPRHTKDVEKQCGRYGKSNKRIALWKYYMVFFFYFSKSQLQFVGTFVAVQTLAD